MNRVGMDLYLEMLEEAVARIKGNPLERVAETEVTLGLPAHIPETYIEDGRERLRCYKALTSATTGAAREDVALSMRDRFGPFPEELRNFLAMLDFKQFLAELQVQKADVYDDHVRLIWPDGQTAVSPEDVISLTAAMPGSRILPPSGLHLPLSKDVPFSEGLRELRAMLERLHCKA